MKYLLIAHCGGKSNKIEAFWEGWSSKIASSNYKFVLHIKGFLYEWKFPYRSTTIEKIK
jgi:hypothetical protein